MLFKDTVAISISAQLVIQNDKSLYGKVEYSSLRSLQGVPKVDSTAVKAVKLVV